MAESLVKGLAATHAVSAKAKRMDGPRHAAQRFISMVLPNATGAVAEDICMAVMQADITVTKFYTVAPKDITVGANKPELALAKAALTADSVEVELTLDAASRIHYDTGSTHEEHAVRAAVLSATAGVLDVDKGQGLFCQVIVNGTPADLDEPVLVVVEYVLRD